MKFYKEIITRIDAGQQVQARTVFQGNEGSTARDLQKSITDAGVVQKPVFRSEEGGRSCFLEPAAPKERLIILGGGHIALPLCEFAAKTGFRVVVVDDRADFSNPVRFPWAEQTICDSFWNAMESLQVTERDYITILTRGHRHDADCLRYLMQKTEPYYLGMIGSRRRVRGLFDMLEEEGLDREQLNRIHTPIGLDIGGILPEEIAVAILAEIIQVKRRGNPQGRTSGCMTDLDLDVIRYLAEQEEPVAVVTVMETRGSVPRGAGAKMAVDACVQIHGSIGGGCAEKEIIDQAVRMIGTGRYSVVTVDMTGDVAENEGMVCGGTMTVLIES